MSGPAPARNSRSAASGGTVELRATLALFGGLAAVAVVSALPPIEGLLLALAAGAVAVGVRRGVPEEFRPVAALPAWVGLGVAAVFLPAAPGPELVAGLGGLAVLYGSVVEADGGTRAGRGSALPWTILLLAVSTAWGSTLLLPTGTAVVGAAGALLAAAALTLAVLLRVPSRALDPQGSTS